MRTAVRRLSHAMLALGVLTVLFLAGVASVGLPAGAHPALVQVQTPFEPATGIARPSDSPGGVPYVASTIDLRNQSIHAGNFVPGNGRQPYAVAYDPLHQVLFIGNEGTNFITIVGAVNDTILGYIPIATIGVDALIVARDHLYAAGLNLHLVQVVNTTTRQVVANVPASTGPIAFGWDTKRDRVIVAEDTRPYIITVISNTNFTILATQTVRQSPGTVTYDPVDDELFIGDGGDNLNILNASTLAYVTNLTIGFDPWAAVWDPLNDHIFLANQESDNLSDIDAHLNQIAGIIPIGGEPNATCMDPTGHWIYAASGERNNITKINATNTTEHLSIPIGAGPAGMDFDVATHQVVTANFATNNLTFVNATTGAIEAVVQNGFTPAGEAYDPDTNEVYIVDSSTSDLLVWNATSGGLAPPIPLPGGPTQASYDPGTGQLFVLRAAPGWITEIDPHTHTVGRTIQVATGPYGFAVASTFDRIYASDHVHNVIDAYDLTTGAYLGNISAVSPTFMTYCPQTGLVYGVAGFADNALVAIAPSNSSWVAWGGLGILGSAIVCNPFNGTVYVANDRTQNVTLLNGTTLASQGTYYAGFGGDGLAFDPFNAELLVSDALDNNVSIIGTVNASRVGIVNVGAQPGASVYVGSADVFLAADYGSGTVSILRPNTPSPTLGSVTLSPALVYTSVNTTFSVIATPLSDFGIPPPPGVAYRWGVTPSALAMPTGSNTSMESFRALNVTGSGTVDLNATLAGRTLSVHLPLEVVGPPPVPLASASVAPSSATLLVGATAGFNASALLDGGAPAPASTVFTWTMIPVSLATLNSTTGSAVALTAQAIGTGTLQLSAWYAGSYAYASVPVSVQGSPTVQIASVSIAPTTPTLDWGANVTLNATVIDTLGLDVSLQATYTWKLLDPLNGTLRIAPGRDQIFTAPRANVSATVSVTATIGASSAIGQAVIRVVGSPNGSGGGGSPEAPGLLSVVPWWGWTALVVVVLAVAAALLIRRRPPRAVVADLATPVGEGNPWANVRVEDTEIVSPEPEGPVLSPTDAPPAEE